MTDQIMTEKMFIEDDVLLMAQAIIAHIPNLDYRMETASWEEECLACDADLNKGEDHRHDCIVHVAKGILTGYSGLDLPYYPWQVQ